MPDKYRVHIRFEPILSVEVGHSSGHIPAHGIVFRIPSAQASILVQNDYTLSLGADGQPVGTRKNQQLVVELAADSDEGAERQALSLATRLCRLEALMEDVRITLTYFRPGVMNLSHPPDPRRGVVSTQDIGLNNRTKPVEDAWQRLDTLADATIRDAVELGLEWVYIAAAAHDDRTAFLAYWTALELMLELIPPLSAPETAGTVVQHYVPDKRQRQMLRSAVCDVLAQWIPDRAARERVCKQMLDTKMESDVERWSYILTERGVVYQQVQVSGTDVMCQQVPVTPERLRNLQVVRHRLVHRGGTPSSDERKKGQHDALRTVPVPEVKSLAIGLLRKLLG